MVRRKLEALDVSALALSTTPTDGAGEPGPSQSSSTWRIVSSESVR